jgi:hypothetical protein
VELGEYGMKPYLLRLVACLFVVLSFNAKALVVVDKSTLNWDYPNNPVWSVSSLSSQSPAQTFTVGQSGIFDSLMVKLRSPHYGGHLYDINATLWEGGQELGSVFLEDQSIAYNGRDEVNFDFSTLNISVSQGQVLSFGIASTAPTVGGTLKMLYVNSVFYDFDTLSYVGGNFIVGTNYQAVFETTLSPVPLPAAFWLFSSGLISLRLFKWQSHFWELFN